jgi:hypothetical protein
MDTAADGQMSERGALQK